MARIVDFNINHNRSLPSTSSSCSVVINNVKNTNSTAAPEYPQQMVYPNPVSENTEAKYYPSVSPNIYTQNVGTPISEVNFEELYKLLAITFSNILKDNNPKLIANLIDNSGKIIVDATNLVRIIALICAAPEADVHIEYVLKEKEVGCLASSKINPIKLIENIKIGYIDFKLGFNDKYNMLTDTFNISLKKCIIL